MFVFKSTQPKIHQLQIIFLQTAVPEHYVFRLYISMHDVLRMNIFESFQQAFHYISDMDISKSFALNNVEQVAAIQHIQYHVV